MIRWNPAPQVTSSVFESGMIVMQCIRLRMCISYKCHGIAREIVLV